MSNGNLSLFADGIQQGRLRVRYGVTWTTSSYRGPTVEPAASKQKNRMPHGENLNSQLKQLMQFNKYVKIYSTIKGDQMRPLLFLTADYANVTSDGKLNVMGIFKTDKCLYLPCQSTPQCI